MVDFKALAAPFDPEEISWRLGTVSREKMKGMALAYLDARAVMDRLDAVCGPAGWQCRYSHANGKTVCDIGVLATPPGDALPEWIWKADGAGDSDIEAEKGALSDAFKRAAVRWGIGRYLYSLASPWVEIEEWGRSFRIKQGAYKELDMVLRRATQAIRSAAPPAANPLAEAKDDIARMQNAGQQPVSEIKSAGRKAAEEYAAIILRRFGEVGFDHVALASWYAEPGTPKGTKTNRDKLAELREKHPDLADRIDNAAEEIRLRRAA